MSHETDIGAYLVSGVAGKGLPVVNPDGTPVGGVGTNGDAAPGSSTAIGSRDASGNLHQVTEGRAAAAGSLPVVLSNEDLAAILAGTDVEMGKTYVGNMREKFRETFNTKDASNWDFSEAASDNVFIDGNVAGESYAVFSKSATVRDTTSSWLSKKSFKLPYKAIFGMSLAQRVGGEEFAVEMVGVDGNGNVIENSAPASVAISGTITIASNVATVNFALPHGIFQGAPVVLAGNARSELNVGPVVATVVNPTQVTVPCTVANGTYTAGGTVTYKDPEGFAANAFGTRWLGASAGNADAVSANGASPRIVSFNPGNTQDTAVIPNEGGINYASRPFTRAFRSRGSWHMEHQTDQLLWSCFDTDITTAARLQSARDTAIPTGMDFKIRLRATTFANKSIPVARITSISKSGTSTATVTTDIPHGLSATNSQVQIYGVRDQAVFGNNATPAAVASVVDATHFTLVLGGAATATSYGGYVMLVNGLSAPLQSNIVAQTYAKTADGLRMSVVGNTTWALTIGATYTAYGFVNASNAVIAGIEGRWRVASQVTTTLELEPLDGQVVSSLPGAPTNCGGGFIANSDFRMNRLTILDRFALKVESSTAGNVASRAMPVVLNGTAPVSGTVTATQGTRGTVGAGWYFSPDNVLVADIASAAITSTATSAAVTPTPVGGSAVFSVPVTAVSGTTPTLDLAVEESDDTGTNWYRVYEFPRITATGFYRSPQIPLNGNRIRYVRTISGTTPSFTMAVNRVTNVAMTPPMFRQRFDRAISLTTLNSTSGEVVTGGASNYRLDLKIGAVTTTAPQVQLQGTNDNGLSWVLIGSPLLGVASSTVSATVTGQNFDRIRAIVTTAGVGVTADYLLIRAYAA